MLFGWEANRSTWIPTYRLRGLCSSTFAIIIIIIIISILCTRIAKQSYKIVIVQYSLVVVGLFTATLKPLKRFSCPRGVCVYSRRRPTIVAGGKRSAASLSVCVCLSARESQNGWNYNHQTCYRSSPSWVPAIHLILAPNTPPLNMGLSELLCCYV